LKYFKLRHGPTVLPGFLRSSSHGNEGSTARQASTDGDSGVHRLRDLVVEEVSLVDRAANTRRFLVVKRSRQMAGDDKVKYRGTSQEGRPAPAAAHGRKKTSPSPATTSTRRGREYAGGVGRRRRER